MHITFKSKLKFTNNIAWQIESNKNFIYIFNFKNYKWYCFEEGISKDIWLLIYKKYNFNEIIEYFMNEYNVEYKILYDDVSNYISQLEEEGLVISYE